RISVTQRCNLHCFYCHREGEDYESNREMTPEEIETIIRVVSSFGVGKVKITGGEPLLRGDILEIIEGINRVPGISEISMTTNGVLLNELAGPLREAGLARVNVSLDTLNPETYKMITGVDSLERVLSGIRKAAEVGLYPVKVNMVLLRGLNDGEIWDMAKFAGENGLILQLIELESAVENELYKRFHVDLTRIERELERRAEKVIVREMHHRRKYFLPDGVEVEVVRPMHNTEFCKYCTRMRITSDGRFKPCLFRSDNLVDFLGPMRSGASIDELAALFLEAVRRRKPYFM
ncbi:GTP 3',8-cyclase MoaA, partial [Candidatus Bathyarchaeota archaeon]